MGVNQYGRNAVLSEVMPCYNYPASLVNQNEILIELTNIFYKKYVLNGHEDFDQYCPYATPSEIMTCYSYPESLVNKIRNIIDLTCQRDYLTVAVFIPIMRMKIFDQYDPNAIPSEKKACYSHRKSSVMQNEISVVILILTSSSYINYLFERH